MSMFAFMFVSIDGEMIEAFKVAIVTISVFFSLQSIYVFSTSGGASLGFEAKNIVGSQRYGFIYLMAFWILYLSTPSAPIARIFKGGAVLTIIIGLFLTFSRASIVGLMLSISIYFLWSLREISPARIVTGIVIAAAAVAVILYLVNIYFPVIFKFFDLN